MNNRLSNWLRQSHRLLHIAVGALTGLFLGFPAALSAAVAFEAKDYQWGGRPEWIDFALTVAGGTLGSFLRWLVIGRFM